jgi:hypothetical protein
MDEDLDWRLRMVLFFVSLFQGLYSVLIGESSQGVALGWYV